MTRVELYWIPLGAGGSGFVRLNGRIYEWFKAGRDGRPPRDLYHTAMRVHTPTGRYVVETMWPRPDRELTTRGVVFAGAVGSPVLGRARIFQYEVRVWLDGNLPDAGDAVGGPQLVSTNPHEAAVILEAAHHLPNLVWGRDEIHCGEMWNSNSVVSWLLARAGLQMDSIRPPHGGRAPGWTAGLAMAEHPSEPGSTPNPARGRFETRYEASSDVIARSE